MQVPEGETKEFLGQEFVTWLWYQGETKDWSVSLGEEGQVGYWMDELLVLQPDDPVNCSQKLAGTGPTNTAEAQAGLVQGKKVAATRLIFVYNKREWTFTLHADSFNFGSVKLQQPTTVDAEDRFAELADDLEELTRIFERIYHRFLEIRLSDHWHHQELPAMQQWIAQRQIP